MNKADFVVRQFESSSSAAVYTAIIHPTTLASSCDCRGWIFKRGNQPRACKHTKALEAEFSKGATPAAIIAKANPQVRAQAQAEVEQAVSLVRGRRLITFDDEPEPVAAPAPAAVVVPVPAQVAAEPTHAPAIKPMLASAMKEGVTIADFEGDAAWVMEEKYDGHRMLLVVNGAVRAWSRPGADRPAAERALPPALLAELSALPKGVYDGELYIPGGTSSDVTRLDRAGDLRFVLFDIAESLGVDVTMHTLERRRKFLALAVLHVAGERVELAAQHPVTLDRVQAIWSAKGEGAILKRLDSTYKSGFRTPAWVKVKGVDAAVLEIVGFDEGKRGPRSVVVLRDAAGIETKASVRGNAMLAQASDAWIGQRLVISYMGRTPTGSYRHPVFDHFAGVGE